MGGVLNAAHNQLPYPTHETQSATVLPLHPSSRLCVCFRTDPIDLLLCIVKRRLDKPHATIANATPRRGVGKGFACVGPEWHLPATISCDSCDGLGPESARDPTSNQHEVSATNPQSLE